MIGRQKEYLIYRSNGNNVSKIALKTSIAEKQRTALATRPLIEALADKSRTAFTINSSEAPPRRKDLLERWEYALRKQRKPYTAWMFRYMVAINRPNFSADDKWLPVRPLGAGSFGAVGLFQHEDEYGQVDDYVVAKYAMVEKNEAIQKNIEGISREAAIMIQLNETPSSEGVLFLRNFRHYADANVWLHLLEYCPGLNLEALRLTYKAMRRKIPEAFLWYVFYGLAKGLVTMERGPFREDLDPKRRRKGAYLVHRDMKPENTFLGFALGEENSTKHLTDAVCYMAKFLEYPHTKIADFGLSKIQTNGHANNTAAEQAGVGTPYYRPPEMRVNKLPSSGEFYPFAKTCFNADGTCKDPKAIRSIEGHAFTSAGNTFVVGYMMYQMITLDEPDGMSHMLDRILARKEAMPVEGILEVDSIKRRTNYINSFASEDEIIAHLGDEEYEQRRLILSMLMNWRDAAYSDSLKELVDECLRIQPEDRIGSWKLLESIEFAMKEYLYEATQSPDWEEESIAYTKEEDLTFMEPGDADIYRDDGFWRQLMRAYKWLDPGIGCIRPDLRCSDMTDEAKAFFAPGMREDKNRDMLKRDVCVQDSQAEIQILNPSKRRKGYNGEALKLSSNGGVREHETPAADIRLSETEAVPETPVSRS